MGEAKPSDAKKRADRVDVSKVPAKDVAMLVEDNHMPR